MPKRTVDALLVGYENQPNLGLRYIAAYLTDQGYRVALLPFTPDDSAGMLDAVMSLRPGLIGFSLIFQYTLSDFAPLLAALRNGGVTAHLTAGGHYPSLCPERTFEHLPQLDSIVRFEGEETLRVLLGAIMRGQDWRAVEGIAFKDGTACRRTTTRPLFRNLDTLPWPIRGCSEPAADAPTYSFPMLASRGCLYDCSFCSIREFYHGAPGAARRSRSADDVAAEMKHLYDTHGARVFLFQDDDFALRGIRVERWVRAFLRALDANGLSGNIAWKISSRVDDIADAQLLAECRQRGLVAVYLGIESGSDTGLKTLNKRVTVAQNLQAIQLLKDAGVAFDLGFMLFDPDSTFESVTANLDFLAQIADFDGPPLAFVKMLPLAGTAIERRLRREGRLEGTELRPNYQLLDPRLEYFSLFTTLVFSDRNSSPDGFVERFRQAYFLGLLADRFNPGKAASRYLDKVCALIRAGNRSALELLRDTLAMVGQQPDARGVALNWPRMRAMADIQEAYWSELLATLDRLDATAPPLPWLSIGAPATPAAAIATPAASRHG